MLLYRELDRLNQDLETTPLYVDLEAGEATILASALSVSLVIWSVRGSFLLASSLSTLPAWMVVDPLPILDTFTEAVGHGGESMQQIIEAGQRAIENAKKPPV